MALAFRPVPDSFSVENLWDLPRDDGLRYELLDGVLIVSPSPSVPHQFFVWRLVQFLGASAPKGVVVLPAPTEYRAATDRCFEPDVVVAWMPEVLEIPAIETPPMLLVEVSSPSTRVYDRTTKRFAYDEAGVGAYWMVQPSIENPSVTILERDPSSGALVELATVEGDDVYRTAVPWELEVCPAALVR